MVRTFRRLTLHERVSQRLPTYVLGICRQSVSVPIRTYCQINLNFEHKEYYSRRRYHTTTRFGDRDTFSPGDMPTHVKFAIQQRKPSQSNEVVLSDGSRSLERQKKPSQPLTVHVVQQKVYQSIPGVYPGHRVNDPDGRVVVKEKTTVRASILSLLLGIFCTFHPFCG